MGAQHGCQLGSRGLGSIADYGFPGINDNGKGKFWRAPLAALRSGVATGLRGRCTHGFGLVNHVCKLFRKGWIYGAQSLGGAEYGYDLLNRQHV
jgi:hypothetical protein